MSSHLRVTDQALGHPDTLKGDATVSTMLGKLQLVLAPRLSDLVTKHDCNHFATEGSIHLAGLLRAHNQCCKRAHAAHATLLIAHRISELFPTCHGGDSPTDMHNLFLEFHKLDVQLDSLPGCKDEEHALAVQSFKCAFNLEAVAKPKLVVHVNSLASSFNSALSQVLSTEKKPDFQVYFEAAHNVRKMAMWDTSPDELKASLIWLDNTVRVLENVDIWTSMQQVPVGPPSVEWNWAAGKEAVDILFKVAADPNPMQVALSKHVKNDSVQAQCFATNENKIIPQASHENTFFPQASREQLFCSTSGTCKHIFPQGSRGNTIRFANAT